MSVSPRRYAEYGRDQKHFPTPQIPLMPERIIGDLRRFQPRVTGVLHVLLRRASKLTIRHSFIRMGLEVDKVKDTRLVYGSQNPEYNSGMFFRVLAADQVT